MHDRTRSPRHRYRTTGERVVATGPSFHAGLRTATFWTACQVDVHGVEEAAVGGAADRVVARGGGDGGRRGEQASGQVHDYPFPRVDVTPAPKGRYATLKVRGIAETGAQVDRRPRPRASAEPGRVSLLAIGDHAAVHSLHPACPAASSIPL
ncbi:hypothetical protein [Streptomyces sp. NBC_00151]|uniref:hypothetical protein n=1 Tax=Streptomyces sp. NBC_00151 TaxID=2975669 RepID=UPI002DDA8585|nr:hypothetical protein [Streptomyces sp. NBC_00151]WRZ45575.1 hypothetical protein OG915_44480 [Streptomyces sp. NBC_00151]